MLFVVLRKCEFGWCRIIRRCGDVPVQDEIGVRVVIFFQRTNTLECLQYSLAYALSVPYHLDLKDYVSIMITVQVKFGDYFALPVIQVSVY